MPHVLKEADKFYIGISTEHLSLKNGKSELEAKINLINTRNTRLSSEKKLNITEINFRGFIKKEKLNQATKSLKDLNKSPIIAAKNIMENIDL